ncbi:MAG: DUF5675 family protein [Ramlibacter sp.]
MNLTLQRTHAIDGRTFGVLLADGRFVCWTLEDAVREVPGQPVAVWKVKGATAIPAGAYRVTLENSPRFGPDTLTVNDVPGFTGVRMHAGNTEADTEGCPLLGMAVEVRGIVGGQSGPAVKIVRELVRQARMAGQTVRMDVINPVVPS